MFQHIVNAMWAAHPQTDGRGEALHGSGWPEAISGLTKTRGLTYCPVWWEVQGEARALAPRLAFCRAPGQSGLSVRRVHGRALLEKDQKVSSDATEPALPQSSSIPGQFREVFQAGQGWRHHGLVTIVTRLPKC